MTFMGIGYVWNVENGWKGSMSLKVVDRLYFFFCNDHIFEVQLQDVGSYVMFESIGHV